MFAVAIQDLKMLDNGLLLSCAYHGKIKCWRYNTGELFDEISKDGQQLRCMDAVTESGTLLIGTNTFAILTQSITDWINFSGFADVGGMGNQEHLMIEYDEYGEEIKYDSDEDYAGNNPYGVDDSDYDVMEGQTVDEALQDIVNANKKGALAYLQEQERKILAQDAQQQAQAAQYMR